MSFILTQGFHVGSLYVHWYGVVMACAILAAYFVARLQFFKGDGAGQPNGAGALTREQFDDAMFWMLIAGFVGARLYHVLSSGSYYFVHPVQILEIWNGGLGIYGAVALGAIALWWFARSHRTSFGRLADAVAVSLTLAQAIGRFGNFINYEAFGYPTTLPWKMYVPLQFRPERYASFAYFTPTFAYEAIWDIAVFIALLWLSKKKRQKPGSLVLWYLALYSFGRFFIETQRIDSTFVSLLGAAFRLNQVVSLFTVLAASGILFWRWHKTHKSGTT